ncbi:Elongation factor [Trichinella spiralis]|uniref:Elongation factor n=1 Tax=Trichinella spiralis TaxID=6334 RepID=A0ABR3KZY3_TRISP
MKMSSPRGTIVVNEMDVADADSWVELSHDSECGSSITFLTDPSGAHGSPHKYTPPGGQTSPVLQFDGWEKRLAVRLEQSSRGGAAVAWKQATRASRGSVCVIRALFVTTALCARCFTNTKKRLNSSSAILALITNNKCDMLDECSYYLYIIEHKWSKQSSSAVAVVVVLIAIGFRSY